MNRKVPFTLPQVVLTSVSTILFVLCIGADIAVIYLGSMNGRVSGGAALKLNLAVAAAALGLSLFLIFKTDKINAFGKSRDKGDPSRGISALRTYFCMLSLDIAVTLCLMPAGLAGLKNAETAVMIFAPVFFVLSAVIYFISASRIGLEDFDADENSDEINEEINEDIKED